MSLPAIKEWPTLYLSANGRLPRRTYIYSSLALPVVGFVIILLAALILSPLAIILSDSVFEVVGVLVALPLIYSSFVITIKRLHDLNRSGWWIVANFVPILGPIIFFIILWFLPGTRGLNRFGDQST